MMTSIEEITEKIKPAHKPYLPSGDPGPPQYCNIAYPKISDSTMQGIEC